MTPADRRELATYLRGHAASDREYARRVMVCEADAEPLETRAAKLTRWADALEAEAVTRALSAIDLPATPPGDAPVAP